MPQRAKTQNGFEFGVKQRRQLRTGEPGGSWRLSHPSTDFMLLLSPEKGKWEGLSLQNSNLRQNSSKDSMSTCKTEQKVLACSAWEQGGREQDGVRERLNISLCYVVRTQSLRAFTAVSRNGVLRLYFRRICWQLGGGGVGLECGQGGGREIGYCSDLVKGDWWGGVGGQTPG